MYSHVQYSTGCQRYGDKWKRFSKQNKRLAASLPHGALQSGETDNERMRGRWRRYARRLQDIESDTGYDTRRRVLDGVFARVSQTVYDTC